MPYYGYGGYPYSYGYGGYPYSYGYSAYSYPYSYGYASAYSYPYSYGYGSRYKAFGNKIPSFIKGFWKHQLSTLSRTFPIKKVLHLAIPIAEEQKETFAASQDPFRSVPSFKKVSSCIYPGGEADFYQCLSCP